MARGYDCFLVHEKIGADVRLRRLPPDERWVYVAGVLALAAQSPRRGWLLVADGLPATTADIAFEAGVSESVAASALESCRRFGLVTTDGDVERPASWDTWQPAPRHSETRAAWKERKRRERERKQTAPVSPEVERLCRLLAQLVTTRDPKARVSHESPRWRDACRLLLEADGRTAQEVERVIRWSQNDDFWCAHVMSMPRLREKFDQLAARSQAAAAPRPATPAPPAKAPAVIVERWERAMVELREIIGDELHGTWFAAVRPVGERDGRLVLAAPQEVTDWLTDRFSSALTQACGGPVEIAAYREAA